MRDNDNVFLNILNIVKDGGNRFWKGFMRKFIILFLIMLTNFVSVNSVFFGERIAVAEEGGGTEGEEFAFMDFMGKVPALGPLVQTISFFTQIGINVSNQGEGEGAGFWDFVTSVTSGAFDPASNTNYNIRKSFQEVFRTNQYCTDQIIYREEQKYPSKQGGGRPENGYNIFPAYPMKFVVRDNQCTFENENSDDWENSLLFIKTSTGAGDPGAPIETRCSYSYTAEHSDCILNGALPLIIESYTLQMTNILTTTIGPCASATQAKAAATKKEKAKKIAKIIGKVAVIAASGVLQMMGASLLSDPYSYIGVTAITTTIEVLFFNLYGWITEYLPTARIWCFLIVFIAAFIHISVMQITVVSWEALNYSKAVDYIRDVTFCGFDWLSYDKQTFNFIDYTKNTNEDNTIQSTEDAKILPIKGIFKNSRYRKIIDCIENKSCAGLNTSFCDHDDCSNVEIHAKDVKNKYYREYLYGGKEYKVNNVLVDVERIKNPDDNRTKFIEYNPIYCIDPRLPEDKGTSSLEQAYYMKGNDKANFACGRFFYYAEGSGCILPSDDVNGDDQAILKNKEIEILKDDGSGEFDKKKYYEIKKTDKELFSRYEEKCQIAFQKARECCDFRSRNFICLEKRSKKDEARGTFCFANVIYENTSQESSSMFDYLLNRNDDDYKVTCKVKLDDNSKGGFAGEFEATKKFNTDQVCVMSANFCPYNFRLNAGINYKASFCDTSTLNISTEGDGVGIWERSVRHFNKDKCEKGYFYSDNTDKNKDSNRKSYAEAASMFGYSEKTYTDFVFDRVKSDMKKFNNNDFELIYDFTKYPGSNDNKNKIKEGNRDISYSEFYAMDNGNVNKIKNFCQYSAHCVTVDIEGGVSEGLYDYDSLFMDASCGGSSQNSRLRNIGGLSKITLKQLTTPIVECIYESLGNLVRGVSGSSLCESGYAVNADGYCGNDTKEIIDSVMSARNLAYLNGRYKKGEYGENGNEFIVKGYRLPEAYNPFFKLQSNLIGVVKILFALFLVLFFAKQLLEGNNFVGNFKASQLASKAFEFAVVMWLCVGTGIQDVVFEKVIDFSMGFYNLTTTLFSAAIVNPHNQILTQDGEIIEINIKQKNSQTSVLYNLCFRRDFLGNLALTEVNASGTCPLGYRKHGGVNDRIMVYAGNDKTKIQSIGNSLWISNNHDIEALLYYVDKINKKTSEKVYLAGYNENIEIETLSGVGLWNKNYDGCYFDTNEYPEGKSYLAIFDTLDCKFARYIGFTANSGAPNLLIYSTMMLFSNKINNELKSVPIIGAFTNLVNKLFTAFGQFLFTIMLTFFFGILAILIKIVFNFVQAFFTLSLLMFLTPIVLPFRLYEKTKYIADAWIKNIIGAATSPILNIAMTMVFLNIFDMLLLGGLSSSNNGAITFEEHNNYGRMARMICKDDTNVLCFLQKFPIFGQLAAFFEDGLGFHLLINLMVSIAAVMMGEDIIKNIDSFVSNFIDFGGQAPNNFIKDHDFKMSDANSFAKTAAGKAIDVSNKAIALPGAHLEMSLNRGANVRENLDKYGILMEKKYKGGETGTEEMKNTKYAKKHGKMLKKGEEDIRAKKEEIENLQSEAPSLQEKDAGAFNKKLEKSQSELKKLEAKYDRHKLKVENPDAVIKEKMEKQEKRLQKINSIVGKAKGVMNLSVRERFSNKIASSHLKHTKLMAVAYGIDNVVRGKPTEFLKPWKERKKNEEHLYAGFIRGTTEKGAEEYEKEKKEKQERREVNETKQKLEAEKGGLIKMVINLKIKKKILERKMKNTGKKLEYIRREKQKDNKDENGNEN